MPAQFYNDPATTTISGSVVIANDARTGDAASLTVGNAALTTASSGGAALTISTNNTVAISEKSTSGANGTLNYDGGNSWNLKGGANSTFRVGDVNSNNFLTTSAALTNILSLVLELSASSSASINVTGGAAMTIATNTGIISRTAPSTAGTGAILQAGTVNGQIVIVTNENVASTANTITFSSTIATANVINDGTNPQVIKCGTAKAFIWLASLNSAAGAWVALAPFAG